MLNEAMIQYFAVYMTDYKDVLQFYQENASEDLAGSIDMHLTDPPSNARRNAMWVNSDHERLTVTDMTSVADMLEQFLNKGGRELIFFQFKKFPVCYNNFCAI